MTPTKEITCRLKKRIEELTDEEIDQLQQLAIQYEGRGYYLIVEDADGLFVETI